MRSGPWTLCALTRMRLTVPLVLYFADQSFERNPKSIRKTFGDIKSRGTLAAFQEPDIGTVNTGFLREGFLGKALRQPVAAHNPIEQLREFGARGAHRTKALAFFQTIVYGQSSGDNSHHSLRGGLMRPFAFDASSTLTTTAINSSGYFIPPGKTQTVEIRWSYLGVSAEGCSGIPSCRLDQANSTASPCL